MSGTAQLPLTMALPFRWAGREGEVRVEIKENDDPAALGCEVWARGFPVCTAEITPPSRGYTDMLGWAKRGREIEFLALESLPAEGWDSHREYLARRFPDWAFPPGFFQDPLGS